MNAFVKKIGMIKNILSLKKGSFDFFALIELDELEKQWDILFSAEWLPENKSEASDILIDIMYDLLEEKDLLLISRIIPLDLDEPFISKVLEQSEGHKELSDVVIN